MLYGACQEVLRGGDQVSHFNSELHSVRNLTRARVGMNLSVNLSDY